jgi:hypothetical protein
MFDPITLTNQFVEMRMRELRLDGCRRCARVKSNGRIRARW